MRFIPFLITLFFFTSVYAQSKKEFIENLQLQNDSLIGILNTERELSKNSIEELNSKLVLSNQEFQKSLTIIESINQEKLYKDSVIYNYKRLISEKNNLVEELKIKNSKFIDSIENLKELVRNCNLYKLELNEESTDPETSSVSILDLKNTPQGFVLNDTLYSGSVHNTSYNNSSKDTILLGSLQKGLKDGIWLEIDRDYGHGISIINYKNGIKTGLEIEMDKDITDMEKTPHELYQIFKQITDNVSFLYFINKTYGYSISYTLTNYLNGKKTGEYIDVSWESLIKGNYINDLKDGQWSEYQFYDHQDLVEYFKIGNLTPKISKTRFCEIHNYKNDGKDGIYESYYSGLISRRIYYKNNEYDGNYESYDSSGNLEKLQKYSKGTLLQ